MPGQSRNALDGVAETLLIPLHVRAQESQRPDAPLKDERAVAFISERGSDLSRVKGLEMDDGDRIALVLRNRQFDRLTRDFLSRHPDAVVVHIGCGLDSRFERVDDGRVDWFDLDLPQVIELRREFIGGGGPRYHLLACSAFDCRWLDTLSERPPQDTLFVAEGVFMYFDEAEVRSLVVSLCDHFPGSELACDAFSPFLVRMNNRRMARSELGARYNWGLAHAKDIEAWGDGIRLLDEWFPLRSPEPRLGHLRWIRWIPPLARVMGVFHYRLGDAPG
jgi:O-methyltransferase involved in polyketide biosynthesis